MEKQMQKGSYKKAFTGISHPNEETENPEAIRDIEDETLEENKKKDVAKAEERGVFDSLNYYSEKEKIIVEKRLKNLGYL